MALGSTRAHELLRDGRYDCAEEGYLLITDWADPSRLYHSPVVEIRAGLWSRHRITLIGDAAHALGPVWAQGGALGLEDGLVLAELLAQRSDWARVGAEFEQRRRPRIAHVQSATDRMSRLAALPVWLRDLAGSRLGPASFRAAYGPLREPVSGARSP